MKRLIGHDDRLENCDKCGSKIVNGECSCGYWYEKDEHPPMMKTLERAIEAVNFYWDQTNSERPLSADHHSGTCFVFFKGTYEDCCKVSEYIERLK